MISFARDLHPGVDLTFEPACRERAPKKLRDRLQTAPHYQKTR